MYFKKLYKNTPSENLLSEFKTRKKSSFYKTLFNQSKETLL